NGFLITTMSDDSYAAEKLILATGVRDLLPDIKGFAACWGISVVHCPYCHGYEFRHRKTGILANADKAFHLASLVNNLTDDLHILATNRADFDPEQLAKLEKHGIRIKESEIKEIEHEQGVMKSILFKDGSRESFDALYAAVPFAQHTDIPHSLGCEMTEHGYVKVDSFQRTNIPGVFACGDNSSMMRSVANAVSSGNLAGAVVNKVLTDERF
ncbi:MAG TPA: NAD(P)/FAD-dependent oxidoreductase, partial [Cyclobacteriaceae bacterium]|nr:NAD(P)/FAD-dependent oxidoreductase [Cyclobacteriaceae bacterium]